jgi:hypothetical protein
MISTDLPPLSFVPKRLLYHFHSSNAAKRRENALLFKKIHCRCQSKQLLLLEQNLYQLLQ